jgi:arylsulfatase A-like enzyme
MYKSAPGLTHCSACLNSQVGKYHLGFPLPKGQGKGRNKFGGGGRGLSYDELAEVVRTYGGFDETPAVWGGNKQTAQSPHNPEWMAAQAVAFVHRAATKSRQQPFFLYFAGTVPHSPFSLPASFEVNVTRTPAGSVPFVREWQDRRNTVLRRLVANGLVC